MSAVLCLIAAFMAFEVGSSAVSGSLAILADAGHMLTDVGAIGGSLFAMKLARKPAGGTWTYGYKRAEILAAQANGYTLLVVAVLLAVDAVRRLVTPAPVQGIALVVVAGVGVAVNLLAAWMLHQTDHGSLNLEASFRHIVSDLYAFIGTFVAGLVILLTGFARADSIASLVVVALMLRSAVSLIRASGRVLLEGAPDGVDPAFLVHDIRSLAEVESVHDVHVWTITSGLLAMSAHVLVRTGADCHEVRRVVEELMAVRHGVSHTTLQVDHASAASNLQIGRRNLPSEPLA